MTTVIVNPVSDCSFYDDWKEEITYMINTFSEYLSDDHNVGHDRLKCLVYHVEKEVVILLFPLVKIESDDVENKEHLSAKPAFTVPHMNMSRYVSEFLCVGDNEEDDLIIHDMDLETGMNYHHRCTKDV